MKSHARVVVIGGGALGVGLLYHLVKEGWSDVVLVEKGELTSGSTWHAAGLIPHFVGSLNMAKIHLYGANLYASLEAETGQPTGWHGCGALRLAITEDQADWYRQVKGILDMIGAEAHVIGPEQCREVAPLIDTKDVILGVWTPNDGHTDPTGSTNAMAIGARRGGAEIYRHTLVTDIRRTSGGEWEVVTDKGNIVCEHVVNAAGCYGAQVGAWVGLKLPIVNMIHQYLMTENLDEVRALDKELPVIRDPRSSAYYRQEQHGLIIGPYETSNAQAWALDGVPWEFDQELLPPDLDRLQPHLETAMECIPAFANAGIKRIISGPITHTPDGNFLMGPAPGLRNHWLLVGASIGITQGPGAGKYLAQWMVHGQTEINVREFDPRRYGEHSVRPEYLVPKCIDEYHEMYQVVMPGEHREMGRPLRTTPTYEKLKAKGAVFGDVYGWERAKWFDHKGEGEHYSFRRSNAFGPVGEECRAVRERAGVLDLSSFAKYEVTGADAGALLDRLCANRLPRRDGGIVLGHFLTELGGIESEMTITRLAADHYYCLSAAVAELHDLDWLSQHIEDGEQVQVRNVTDERGVLVLSGPRSRDILSSLTDADLGNAAFRWLTAREIEVAAVPVRALRVSYAGELGWELHTPMAEMGRVYDALQEAGAAHGLADFGTYALNSLRMEKAYKAWGAELTTEITPLEARLERFVDWDKNFLGRDAVLARREQGISLELVYCEVDTPDRDCLGNEPAYDGERIMGVTTGGAYGHCVGKSLAFVYVDPKLASPGSRFEIGLLGERFAATVLAEPAFDPRNERPRA